MKAIPFINTMLNNEYRVYVLQIFNHEIIEEQFENWKMKNMVGWDKFVNYNTNTTIEFYGHGNPYKIKNPDLINGTELTLPYPKTLDDFICDSHRCLVNLEWNSTVISLMNRVFFMEQSKIKEFNIKILQQIEKS